MYAVIDIKTSLVVGTYATLKRARTKADKLDAEWLASQALAIATLV